MQKASEAMAEIHGKLTPEKVDATMYASTLLMIHPCGLYTDSSIYRDKLREQNSLSEEIVTAIAGAQIGDAIDEDELEDELEAIQQEQLDEKMLKSGTVPVADSISKLPSISNGESELSKPALS
jgi:charged multivesicular body protein 4A/B